MAGLDQSQWRSTKGIELPAGEKIAVWRESTDVAAYSLVPRWRWSFPTSTRTYDILSNAKGELFEIRAREKGSGGGWVSEVVWSDEKKAPQGFAGAGRACIECHRTAGQIMDVPGRIYRRERWGSDQVFSFRPYDESGRLDATLPLDVRRP